MRLFLFLILLSSKAYSAPPNCDETDIVPGAVLNTCTTLDINNDVDLTGNGDLGGAIEITGITGDVNINADIILDGAAGITISGDNIPGVNGGPGATGGGGISTNASEPGQGFTPSDGGAGINDGACSSGGGGGAGADSDGGDGDNCSSGASIGAKGTTAGFPIPFAGGYGGGAGGQFLIAPLTYGLGGGGGGGGAIRIETAGNINIANGVRIFARGGNGGATVNEGGGGGGGGGGTIHITAASITNQGIFDVSGGTGGESTGPLPRGGIGGNGGGGIIRLEIGGVSTDLTGRQDFSTNTTAGGTGGGSSSSKLTSDISCGTLTKKSDLQNLYSLALGFAFILLLSNIRRSKKLFSSF